MSSTSVAKAKFDNEKLDFKNIFQAQPPINSGYHFGSRLVIKRSFIYNCWRKRPRNDCSRPHQNIPEVLFELILTDRYQKTIQNLSIKKNWLPEIYQIGVRNPQGMSHSPFDDKIYLTNHGARGGDWFGTVNFGENYGWKILGWGGTNYSGTKIGPKMETWFYKGN